MNMIALLETKTSGRKADNIIAKLGYPNSHCVEALGFSGGIWVCWDDNSPELSLIDDFGRESIELSSLQVILGLYQMTSIASSMRVLKVLLKAFGSRGIQLLTQLGILLRLLLIGRPLVLAASQLRRTV